MERWLRDKNMTSNGSIIFFGMIMIVVGMMLSAGVIEYMNYSGRDIPILTDGTEVLCIYTNSSVSCFCDEDIIYRQQNYTRVDEYQQMVDYCLVRLWN